MDTTVQVALISAAASVIVAALAHVWTRYQRRADELREQKLGHYGELLSAISDLADFGQDQELARRRFANAANTIVLVAPPEVVRAVMDFHQETCASNSRNRTQERHDKLLKSLILRMRRSLDLPFARNEKDIDFHLIGTHIGGEADRSFNPALKRAPDGVA